MCTVVCKTIVWFDSCGTRPHALSDYGSMRQACRTNRRQSATNWRPERVLRAVRGSAKELHTESYSSACSSIFTGFGALHPARCPASRHRQHAFAPQDQKRRPGPSKVIQVQVPVGEAILLYCIPSSLAFEEAFE